VTVAAPRETTMNDALQTVLDFVEGRIGGKDFEKKVYSDPLMESLLQDETLKWHNTYIKSDPYHFLIGLNYDDPGDVLNAQGAMELFLERKGIPFNRTAAHSQIHDLLLAAQPGWLDVDTAYLQTHVMPGVGGLQGKELKAWLNVRLKELFRYHKKPPKWIQNPSWPITENGPMFFLGQIKLDNCEHFHDEAAVYVFLDPTTGETRNVIQMF